MIRYLLALLIVASLQAEDLYFTQTGSGSHNGTIGNPWSTAEASTAGNWGAGAGKISVGDTLHAVGTITSTLTFQSGGTDDSNRITLLFDSGAKFTKGTWGSGSGAIFINSLNWITVNGDVTNGRQGIIDCTDNGQILGHQDGCAGVYANNSTGLTVENLTINNIFVRPAGTAIKGDGVGALVCNYQPNTTYTDFVVNNVYGNNAYIGIDCAFSGAGSARYTFSNCNFTKVNWGIHTGGNNSGAQIDDPIIHDCTFGDYSNWDNDNDDWHHNGIFFAPQDTPGGGYIHGLRVYRCTFNDGYGQFATSAFYANGGDMDSEGVIYDCKFFCPTDYPTNALMNVAIESGNFRFYNNSAYCASGSGAALISVSGRFGGTTAKDYYVNNNVGVNCIMQYSQLMTGTGTTLHENNNIAFGTTLAGDFYYFNAGPVSLATWQGLGFDTAPANPNVDPKFTSTTDLHLLTGSPCTQTGADESAYFTTDYDGVSWAGGTGWGIGAFKFVGNTTPTLSSSVVPSAGTSITLTLSESCTTGSGGSGGVTISATGGAVTATYSSGSGSTAYVYSLSRTIKSNETVNVTYTQPGNGIEATVGGNDLASFSAQPVTNNSTQTPTVIGGWSFTGKATITGGFNIH